MTHTERTEARIVEATRLSDVETMARELAAKLDAVEYRIRRNNSRGIDCDVRDDLLKILSDA